MELGDRVPDLPLTLTSGTPASLHDFRGKWLALYFYPKDSTPGCTNQGIAFNALLTTFRRAGADVLGVSRDSIRSHQNFTAKQGFRFELASDPDEVLCKAFDVIKLKKLYGREYLGIERTTFLIDPAGVIREIWRPVKVPGHAQAVLDALKAASAT